MGRRGEEGKSRVCKVGRGEAAQMIHNTEPGATRSPSIKQMDQQPTQPQPGSRESTQRSQTQT